MKSKSLSRGQKGIGKESKDKTNENFPKLMKAFYKQIRTRTNKTQNAIPSYITAKLKKETKRRENYKAAIRRRAEYNHRNSK